MRTALHASVSLYRRHILNCRFERPLRIVKRFGELLKRGPSSRKDVATKEAGTQAVCMVDSSSTQTATCSSKLKALQQLNSSHNKSQSVSNAPTAASTSFFHPNIRLPPAVRPSPVPILPRYSSKDQMQLIKTFKNSSPPHRSLEYWNDHLRPATAIVSAASAPAPSPSPVARLANYAKSVAMTPGLNIN